MSADPNQKPTWADKLDERPKPVRFVRYDFPSKPYSCREQKHVLPCGGIVCEFDDGEVRLLDTECACGCDAFIESCTEIKWRAV